jgi:preprotein translocase subunit SecG
MMETNSTRLNAELLMLLMLMLLVLLQMAYSSGWSTAFDGHLPHFQGHKMH